MSFTRNLTDLFISASFHRLLQISGSDNIVLDGTGSEVSLSANINLNPIESAFEYVPGSTTEIQPVEITGSNIFSTDPFYVINDDGDIEPRLRLATDDVFYKTGVSGSVAYTANDIQITGSLSVSDLSSADGSGADVSDYVRRVALMGMGI